MSKIQRKRVQLNCSGLSRTKQSFRDECNVNTIMEKYQRTGLIPHVEMHGGEYGDYTNVQDYQSSLNQVIAAQDMFASLPSSLRNRFSNNPASFLDFVSNPSNKDEMRSLGLLKPLIDVPNIVPLDVIPNPSSSKSGG